MNETYNHSDEDIAGGVERFDGRCAHCKLHQPGDLTDDELHQTPVVEDADHCAEVDDDWKDLYSAPSITEQSVQSEFNLIGLFESILVLPETSVN